MKKIAIIGPESTGKSELARQLAIELQTEWVPEYARFYLDRLFTPYKAIDLENIAKGQLAWEDDKAVIAKKYLVCDTNLVVIKIWSDFKYGSTAQWIEDEIKTRKYDYYLLTYIDLPWTPDPQREHPDKREFFMEVYTQYLIMNNLPFGIVTGEEEDRLQSAKSHLQASGIID